MGRGGVISALLVDRVTRTRDLDNPVEERGGVPGGALVNLGVRGHTGLRLRARGDRLAVGDEVGLDDEEPLVAVPAAATREPPA